jgi:hypothetical protein
MAKFFRWITPGQELAEAERRILYYPKDKAFWVFNMEQPYRPSKKISDNRILVKFQFDSESENAILSLENWIWSENDYNPPERKFEGESKHFYLVIVKKNEPGAYGLGANFKAHLKVVSATLGDKAEVSKALGLSELEVTERMKKQKWMKQEF